MNPPDLHIPRRLQVDRLERDASKVLRSVRSLKNTFAPINRIPPELFSLVPQYWGSGRTDKHLIALTHVCQHWREVLTAYSSLWTHLECKDVEKTRVYIERSKYSPLELALHEGAHYHLEDAFLLVIPHISRVISINIVGGGKLFQYFTSHFSCPVPLLRHLNLALTCNPPHVLNGSLFAGDLSSLRTLTLDGIIPHIPWSNPPQLTNFTVFSLVSREEISVTQLLDLFSNAPLLNKIELHTIPKSSDAPPGRVVSLPCLEIFTILTRLASISTLLNHLLIPAGTLLHLGFDFRGFDSPLPKSFPKNPENLQNLLHVTSGYLYFEQASIAIKLDGPSGELDMRGNRVDWYASTAIISECRILSSLDYFDISKIQRLAFTTYGFPMHEEVDESLHYVLNIMDDLRTLFLNQCNNLPLISALDPDKSSQKLVFCPKLENLIFYINDRKPFYVRGLTDMAKGRALKGAKLRSIIVISQGGGMPENEVSKLGEYVEHVGCRFEEREPRCRWDEIPDDGRN